MLLYSSCDELTTPEFSDIKYKTTFDVPDTVNVRIFRNFKQLYELTGSNKTVILRPGGYGIEFYTDYFSYAENLQVSKSGVLNFNNIIDSLTTSNLTVTAPDSVNIKIYSGKDEVTGFSGDRTVRLKKGIYKIHLTYDYLTLDTLINLDRASEVRYGDLRQKKCALIDFIVPDSVLVRVIHSGAVIKEFTSGGLFWFLKGIYNVNFLNNHFTADTLIDLQSDISLSYNRILTEKTSVINFIVPDSIMVKIKSDLNLISEFRGSGILRLMRKRYDLRFSGNSTNIELKFNVRTDTSITFSKLAGLKLKYIQGGLFTQGDNNSLAGYPEHSVVLNDYYIDPYEVTQGLWKSVMGSNPSSFPGNDRLPVETVSWLDAVIFCNKLSEKEGLANVYVISGSSVFMDITKNGYRLPTEAEWEFAARGGIHDENLTYSGSNNAAGVAWYRINAGGSTSLTGLKQPNTAGLYDMSGNVREWCWDWYGGYPGSMVYNPVGPDNGTVRVVRGGGWSDDLSNLKTRTRTYSDPEITRDNTGLRLVRTK